MTASIATVQDIARVMAANQALGAMQFLLPATTDYLTSRKQFGVTLNTFQALTFRAADMYVSLELTHSIVDWATMVVAEGEPEEVADAAAPGLAAGEPGRPARRPGGDPAARRHRDDAEYSVGNVVAHLTALDHLLGDGGHHLRELADAVTTYGALDPLD